MRRNIAIIVATVLFFILIPLTLFWESPDPMLGAEQAAGAQAITLPFGWKEASQEPSLALGCQAIGAEAKGIPFVYSVVYICSEAYRLNLFALFLNISLVILFCMTVFTFLNKKERILSK
jgi:hypothetical protein